MERVECFISPLNSAILMIFWSVNVSTMLPKVNSCVFTLVFFNLGIILIILTMGDANLAKHLALFLG